MLFYLFADLWARVKKVTKLTILYGYIIVMDSSDKLVQMSDSKIYRIDFTIVFWKNKHTQHMNIIRL